MRRRQVQQQGQTHRARAKTETAAPACHHTLISKLMFVVASTEVLVTVLLQVMVIDVERVDGGVVRRR